MAVVQDILSLELLTAGIQGEIKRRVDEDYEGCIYQYAWSSYKELVHPNAIIYPANDNDVIKVINFAKSHNIAIAIRTGGHHYTAASSTKGANVQLDLNDTYTDFFISPNDPTIVTVGISTTLIKFMDKLGEAGLFVPAGQCSYVNLGGHVQTGGYGHLIRSFGLFSDHVQAVRFISADGEKARWIERGVAADKELFYAILGGSPGNFGVITDLRLKVHRDIDHPKSRGMFGKVLYTPKRFKALLDIMVAEDNTEETPADFDYSLTVIGARLVEGKIVPIIVVFVQWANLEGAGQPYDPAFFKKIQDVIGGPLEPHEGLGLNGAEAPMSKLCSFWVFPIAREFQLPYFKRTYITESKTLEKDGWSKWVTGRLDEILLHPLEHHHVAAQFSYLGGNQSRYRIQDPNNDMSFSWRRDSTFACTIDVFYEEDKGPKVKAKAKEWADKNNTEGLGKNGKFSKQDRRLLWGSYDTDLPAARAHYYDSEAKYQRLVKTKKKVDPQLIFTANRFAVGDYRSALQSLGNPF